MKLLKTLAGIVILAFWGAATVSCDRAEGFAPGKELKNEDMDEADVPIGDPMEFPRGVIATFDYDQVLSYPEAEILLRLSRAPLPVRVATIQTAVAGEESAEMVDEHMAYLIKAAVGLDPTGEVTTTVVEECVKPVLIQPGRSRVSFVTACRILEELPMKDAGPAADLLLARLYDEKDDDRLEILSAAFLKLVPDLKSVDALRIAKNVAQGLTEENAKKREWPEHLLAELASRLEPTDANLLLSEIRERVESQPERKLDSRLGTTLVKLAIGMEPEKGRALLAWAEKRAPAILCSAREDVVIRALDLLEPKAIASLAERMSASRSPVRGHVGFQRLIEDMEPITRRMSPEAIRSKVAGLAVRAMAEPEAALKSMPLIGPYARGLNAEETSFLSKWLIEQLKGPQDENLFRFEDLALALVALSPGLTSDDLGLVAPAVIELISAHGQRGKYYLQLLYVVESLEEHLGASAYDVRPLAAILTAAMKAGVDLDHAWSMPRQAAALGALSTHLESSDLQPAAVVMVDAILAEANRKGALRTSRMRDLRMALGSIGNKLSANATRPLVAKLTDRMKGELNGDVLSELGNTVGVLAANLEDEDLWGAISLLAERTKIEQQGFALESLTTALGVLVPKAEATKADSIAALLVERMEHERDGAEIALLGRALAALVGTVDSKQLKPGFRTVVMAMQEEHAGEALGKLANCAAAFLSVLSEEERGEAAEALAARMGLAQYGRMAEFTWTEDVEQFGNPDERKVERNASVLEPAGVQTLIDLLRAPLLAQDYMEQVVLRALELKLDLPFKTVGAVVRWATSDSKALDLDLHLAGPGPWSAFKEEELIALPTLEGLELKPRGTLEVEGAVWSFDIQGDVAYLPAGVAGMHIVNIADPSAPKLLSTVKVGPYAMSCAVSGKHAYVAAGPAGMPESHLRVVDIGDAKTAKVVGSIDLPDYPARVAVRNKHVFVADRTEGLRVIDVSDPKAPREVGALSVPSTIVGVDLASNYAFLADEGVGLRVVDISRPEKPEEVALVRTEGPGVDVFVQGTQAYVPTGEDGLVVIDVSNPREPKQVAVVPSEIAISATGRENLIFTGAAVLGFKVFDLKDPIAPKSLTVETSALGVGVMVRGRHLFVTDVEPGDAPYGMKDRTILRLYEIAD